MSFKIIHKDINKYKGRYVVDYHIGQSLYDITTIDDDSKTIIYITLNKINFEVIKNAYIRLINYLIDNKISECAFPLLASGKYISIGLSYKAIVEAIEEYIDTPLNITLYTKREVRYKERLLACSSLNGTEAYSGLNVDTCDEMPMPSYMPSKVKLSMELNKIFSYVDYNLMLVPMDEVLCPMHFLDNYMDIKGIKRKYFYANGFLKDDCSKARHNKKTFKHEELFRAIVVLGMNRTEALQLLSFAGIAFNPNSKLDIWFHDYLLENDLEPNMSSFMDKYFDVDEIEKIFG